MSVLPRRLASLRNLTPAGLAAVTALLLLAVVLLFMAVGGLPW